MYAQFSSSSPFSSMSVLVCAFASIVGLFRPAGVINNAPSGLKANLLKNETKFSSWYNRNDPVAAAAKSSMVVLLDAIFPLSILENFLETDPNASFPFAVLLYL